MDVFYEVHLYHRASYLVVVMILGITIIQLLLLYITIIYYYYDGEKVAGGVRQLSILYTEEHVRLISKDICSSMAGPR